MVHPTSPSCVIYKFGLTLPLNTVANFQSDSHSRSLGEGGTAGSENKAGGGGGIHGRKSVGREGGVDGRKSMRR